MDAAEEEEVASGAEDARPKRAKLEDLKYVCKVRIKFATNKAAVMTQQALEVDKEISPEKVERTMHVDNVFLVVEIRSTELRLLRASAASFFDMAMVAVRFLCEFA